VDLLVADPDEVERVVAPGRAVVAELTPERRAAILGLKLDPGYRREYGSREVHEAVLDHGVRDRAGFGLWRAERG
jgi:hypothetical protein